MDVAIDHLTRSGLSFFTFETTSTKTQTLHPLRVRAKVRFTTQQLEGALYFSLSDHEVFEITGVFLVTLCKRLTWMMKKLVIRTAGLIMPG
jgi:hypothetical protein